MNPGSRYWVTGTGGGLLLLVRPYEVAFFLCEYVNALLVDEIRTGDVSIDDLANFPDQTVAWYGVRNYQARNFMRDQMKVGDGVLVLSLQLQDPRHRRNR